MPSTAYHIRRGLPAATTAVPVPPATGSRSTCRQVCPASVVIHGPAFVYWAMAAVPVSAGVVAIAPAAPFGPTGSHWMAPCRLSGGSTSTEPVPTSRSPSAVCAVAVSRYAPASLPVTVVRYQVP